MDVPWPFFTFLYFGEKKYREKLIHGVAKKIHGMSNSDKPFFFASHIGEHSSEQSGPCEHCSP